MHNNEVSTAHFGEHLTIDGYDGSCGRLNDRDLVFRCLDELPELLGMKKLSDPYVYHAPDNQIKDPGGWSGFVVILESHISIHTFPRRGFLSADVYTCKNDLDNARIVSFFQEHFCLKEVEINLIKRGTKYPVSNIF